MKIGLWADLHIDGPSLDETIENVRWAMSEFEKAGCSHTILAGDWADTDNIGDAANTPGKIKHAFLSALAPSMQHIILEGNHDKKSATRGSALLLFEDSVETVLSITGKMLTDTLGIVLVPWCYKEQFVSPEERGKDDHNLFLTRVSDMIEEVHSKLSLAGASSIILAAHCRVRGARENLTTNREVTGGFEIFRDTLDLFDYLHLGDIHLRQELIPNKGGFHGAMSQRGKDEEGHPCGISILSCEDGKLSVQWIDSPIARRYYTVVADSLDVNIPKLNKYDKLYVKYPYDPNDEKSRQFREELVKTVPSGTRLLPSTKHSVAARTGEGSEVIVNKPVDALKLYCRTMNISDAETADLVEELELLLNRK